MYIANREEMYIKSVFMQLHKMYNKTRCQMSIDRQVSDEH